MRLLLCTVAGLLLVCADRPVVAAPNVLLILVDDLGFGDFSCFRDLGPLPQGQHPATEALKRYPETPHVDRLAQQGLRLTNFYVASPICSPSRVAITTGQYPSRHLIHSYLASRERNAARGMRDYLSPDVPTIARTFQKSGYATGHFGKWHMGGGRDVDDAPWPKEYGFDKSITSFEGLGDRILPPGGLSEQSEKLGQGTITRAPRHELTRLHVDHALEFIRENHKRPFYVQLWLDDVHDPFQPAPDSAEAFRKSAASDEEAAFFAVLTEVDRQIGRVLSGLDELGLAENTIVVVTSDNGPTAWPRYAQQGIDAPGSTAGFRGRKWSLYEGGIRMPFIIRWPGHVPSGAVDRQSVVASIDLFPTLSEMCGIDLGARLMDQGVTSTASEYFDGVNRSAVLLGNPVGRPKPLFFEYGRDDTEPRPAVPIDRSPNLAIRDGHWKLLVNDDGSWMQLYDLSASEREFLNVAGDFPEIATQLRDKLLAWRSSMPTLPTGNKYITREWDRIVTRLDGDTQLDASQSPPVAKSAIEVLIEATFPGEPHSRPGVLLAHGGAGSGYAVYVADGELRWTTRMRGEATTISAPVPEPGARVVVRAMLARDGRLTLKVDKTIVAQGNAGGCIPSEPTDGLDVGRDRISPVGEYEAPAPFAGTIHRAEVVVHNDRRESPGRLVTRFAADVDPANPLPEYPRPQLTRHSWINLNGHWDYAITSVANVGDITDPERLAKVRPMDWDGRIVVPFCPESMLSGLERRVGEDRLLWYRTEVSLPASFNRPRLRLNFGAVDWLAHVWVDGNYVGSHKGGYDPFSFDITQAARFSPAGDEAAPSDGEHSDKREILVCVWDPTDSRSQPRGKQVRDPHAIWYTPVTGIWQTVWLENVSDSFVEAVHTEARPESNAVRLSIDVAGVGSDPLHAAVRIQFDGETVGERRIPVPSPGEGSRATAVAEVPLEIIRWWTPDDPALYDVHVSLESQPNVPLDEVDSYFGYRTISVGPGPLGKQRILLNGEPVFQYGLLDQGWWPDGLYTAPTDEALRYDIEVTRQLGFNLARKHVKVEPARWYYWCDRLGLLVWQDMPSGGNPAAGEHLRRGAADIDLPSEDREQFRKELQAMIDALRPFPSIVVWVPFNEGWGQHDTNDILKWVREYDPTRLVDGPSGWEDRGWGDLIDLHRYPGPDMIPAMTDRVSVLGEFGGLGLPISGHTWVTRDNWGYRNYTSREQLADEYHKLVEQLPELISKGLSAAIYTQTTDVEIEVNGVMTYDRAIIKIDSGAMRSWHAPLFNVLKQQPAANE